MINQTVNDIKAQTILAEELMKKHISNCEKKSSLGALLFIDETKEIALKQAREIDAKAKSGHKLGKLAGIPFIVKDNIDVAGVSTTAGSKAFEGNKPKNHAPVVQKLVDEDAIILAKANMHELAFGITGLNSAYGDTVNAFDPSRISGGSSSGTAVGVAAQMGLFGLGTDTGGSIRIPSSLNNLVGYRPSKDFYDPEGLINISHTRDTIGLIANNIEDIIYLNQIINPVNLNNGCDGLKGLRLGVPREYYFRNLSKEVFDLVELALQKVKNAGVNLVEKDIPDLAKFNTDVSFIVALYEAKEALPSYFKNKGLKFNKEQFLSTLSSPDVKGIYEQAVFSDFISKEQYETAINEARPKLIEIINDYYEVNQLDGIIFPLTPLEATSIENIRKGKFSYSGVKGQTITVESEPGNDGIFATYIQNTDPGSNAGMPGITIPMGKTTDGLPVGLGIDCKQNYDELLMSIAKHLQPTIS